MSEPRTDIALECSPFLASMVQRQPAWWALLQSTGRLEQDSPPDRATLAEFITTHGLDAGLRHYRNQEMMRIIWRELNRRARLEHTLADLSLLAENCLQAAIESHTSSLHERHGKPCDTTGAVLDIVVIGMGKLGGNELNLSSDIDLIFCYPQAGTCDGSRGLAAEQFFLRLTRAVIRSLSEVTDHGFCFRVDTRLRPFGESGPLVCSFGAMEQYYQREGRDWERYALVKARPVAGDRAAGQQLLKMLQPFVYRRYIDFGAVEALQKMHAAVRKDAAEHGRKQDIKRGPGGIREIEFMVQAHQLLRGGREPRLQTQSLFAALDALTEQELVPAETTETLRHHYMFLRRLENAIQALHDQQTHQLPSGDDLQRVATAMAFTSTDILIEETERVRAEVNALFTLHLQPEEAGTPDSRWPLRWQTLNSGDAAAREGEPAAMQRFLERLGRQSLSQRAAERLDRFMPQLLEQLDQRSLSAEVLADVLELVLAITRRSAYLVLLVQKPLACQRMLDLFTESAWVAGTVIRHPALLDELIDPTLGRMLPTDEELHAAARRALRFRGDTEAVLQALNHMKLATHLRVAVAELETKLSVRQVQASLTELAEALLSVCLQLANEEIGARYGADQESRLCVVGYGSLGAGELDYGSDLDLIFLYDAPQALTPEPVAAPERFYTQVARRLISLLTVPTASGKLYETDTRLRPNGRAGLLVSSIDAFEKYQHEQAWVWERQALTRARALAGNQAVAERFEGVRREVLSRAVNQDELHEQIARMRRRMRVEFRGGDQHKHGFGGLVDIDFIAQLGALETAPNQPKVLDARGTPDQLQRLSEAGWLTQAQAHALCVSHEALCHARHLESIAREPPRGQPDMIASEEICRQLLGSDAEVWFSTDSGA